MSNTLPDYKRRDLERRKTSLIEEHDAVSKQINVVLEERQRVLLQRQLEDLEHKLDEIDTQLQGGALPSSPVLKPRKRTSGIPAELSLPLKDTLLLCAEFADN